MEQSAMDATAKIASEVNVLGVIVLAAMEQVATTGSAKVSLALSSCLSLTAARAVIAKRGSVMDPSAQPARDKTANRVTVSGPIAMGVMGRTVSVVSAKGKRARAAMERDATMVSAQAETFAK